MTKEIDITPTGMPADAALSNMIQTDSLGFIVGSGQERAKDGILTVTLSRKSGTVLRYDSTSPVTSEEFWADNFIDFD